MPNYNSKDGKWFPAKEKVSLVDKTTGEPYIYEGPDRAALETLKETGEEFLGKDFHDDPDIMNRAHERKQTVDEFCKTKINTKEKREAAFKKNADKTVLHTAPAKKLEAKQRQTGGSNTAGTGGNLSGGFGSQADGMKKVK